MPRSQKNDNFIDKTFTVVADVLIKILPTSNREKQAFIYYRDGMSAQSEGEYATALQNYYQALKRNPSLPQALNNIAIIYHYRAEQATEKYQSEVAKLLYDKAADYWNEAIRLAPTNYLEAQAWLQQRNLK